MKPFHRYLLSVVLVLGFTSLSVLPCAVATRCDAEESEGPQENSIAFPREELMQAFASLQVSVIDPPQPMHDFVLETLQGETIDTTQLRGKFLWLSF